MGMPDVITSRKITGTDFVFRVQAFRKLSNAEMKTALKVWMAQGKISKVPKKGMVTFVTTRGYEGELPE